MHGGRLLCFADLRHLLGIQNGEVVPGRQQIESIQVLIISWDSTPSTLRTTNQHIMAFIPYSFFALAILAAVKATIDQQPLGSLKEKPNIVFILTDDQDVELGSLDYMPLIHKHLINQGTLFERHYCTTAICCPSRVTLWTGKNAHNTNVTDIFPPYG